MYKIKIFINNFIFVSICMEDVCEPLKMSEVIIYRSNKLNICEHELT